MLVIALLMGCIDMHVAESCNAVLLTCGAVMCTLSSFMVQPYNALVAALQTPICY